MPHQNRLLFFVFSLLLTLIPVNADQDSDGDGIPDSEEFYGPYQCTDLYATGSNLYLLNEDTTPSVPPAAVAGYYLSIPGYDYIKVTSRNYTRIWVTYSLAKSLNISRTFSGVGDIYFYSDLNDFDGDGIPNTEEEGWLDQPRKRSRLPWKVTMLMTERPARMALKVISVRMLRCLETW